MVEFLLDFLCERIRSVSIDNVSVVDYWLMVDIPSLSLQASI